MIDLSEVEAPPELSPDAERQRRKQRLAAACRVFAAMGFDEGVAGHLTVRDPEDAHHFWVNPFGLHFADVRASDLVLVSHSGEVVGGSRRINRAAFAIHSAIHMARPEVMAAAHAHTVNGRAWASLGRLLAPITQNACVFYEDHALFDDYTGPVLTARESERIAAALGGRKAVILQNHGLLTVGHSVDEAAWWLIALERACQVQLLAEAAGRPIPIDPATAAAARDNSGRHEAGWFSFQPLYRRMVREQPDLLE